MVCTEGISNHKQRKKRSRQSIRSGINVHYIGPSLLDRNRIAKVALVNLQDPFDLLAL